MVHFLSIFFFFLDFFNFCCVFQKFPFFCVTCIWDTAGIHLRILDLELDVGEPNLIRLFWLKQSISLPSFSCGVKTAVVLSNKLR